MDQEALTSTTQPGEEDTMTPLPLPAEEGSVQNNSASVEIAATKHAPDAKSGSVYELAVQVHDT